MTDKDLPKSKVTEVKILSAEALSTEVKQNLSSGKSRTVAVEIKKRSGLNLNRGLKIQRDVRSSSNIVRHRSQKNKSTKNSIKPNVDSITNEKQRRTQLMALLKERDRSEQDRVDETRRIDERIRETRKNREQLLLNADIEKKEAEARIKREEEEKKIKLNSEETSKEKPKGTKVTAKNQAVQDTEEIKSKKQGASNKFRGNTKRRTGKLTIAQAMTNDDSINTREERKKSFASIQRKKEKERQSQHNLLASNKKLSKQIQIPLNISVADLAARMSIRANELVKSLLKQGITADSKQILDTETAELMVIEYGHSPKLINVVSLASTYTMPDEDETLLQTRPPVVTIMGHVDHGKTSLLDKIRKANIVAIESGGITQHIGAYQVNTKDGNIISFIDTPGHKAFTAMRSRGADVTDIVILVVAADDGVQPQTKEAIAHAKAASKPIIVAINKIDRQEANPNNIRQELLSEELVVESLGGDIQCVEVSAITGAGIDSLLEAISLQAEILELKANPDRPAIGVVLEARLDSAVGTVATVLIQRGSLKTGLTIVAGKQWGRVRLMKDDQDKIIKIATPSMPVKTLGLGAPPEPGDDCFVVKNEADARSIVRSRILQSEENEPIRLRPSFEDLFAKKNQPEQYNINISLRADVQGSVEAIKSTLSGLSEGNFTVKVISAGVGGIKESDILLASTSQALLVAFNVRANSQVKELARKYGLDIFHTKIIYEIIDHINLLRKGLEPAVIEEKILGKAEVREVFGVSKLGKVAGVLVVEGLVRMDAKIRLIRDEKEVYVSTIQSLRRVKSETKEVVAGTECGIGIKNYSDIKSGDIIECFELIEQA